MKKYLLMLFVAIATISCSKKVEVKGNFAGGSPLERIEFVEASGVATLPLVNMGAVSYTHLDVYKRQIERRFFPVSTW